jgi:chemotaxis protein MotB
MWHARAVRCGLELEHVSGAALIKRMSRLGIAVKETKMTRLGVLGVLAGAFTLCAGNVGCYLDQLQAEQRNNRVLQEDLARTKADLQDAEGMNKQKDTVIDGLNKQLVAKDETVGSLTAENAGLRDALKKAQDILEAQAGRPGSTTMIIKGSALPEPLNAKLEDFAKKYPDILEYDPKTGMVRWKSDLLFPLGSDKLAEAGQIQEALKKFAEIVNSPEANGFDVIVVGYTCTTPIKKAATLAEHKTNWHLSCHRAIAVMNMLAQDDVAMTRMGVMGYGEYRPIADNSTEAGKAKNRRVEIYLVPQGSIQSMGGGVAKTAEGAAFVRPSELPGIKAKANGSSAAKPRAARAAKPKTPAAPAAPAEAPAKENAGPAEPK